MSVIGWDIGGVNTKVARAELGRLVAVRQQPYELQRAPHALVSELRELAAAVGADAAAHAVTMTAELSQMFRTKAEGVSFVLDAVEAAFPRALIQVFGVDGVFRTIADARARPLVVAAANWAATAAVVGASHPDAILVDVGTTTTDIIPIVAGRVVPRGVTDLSRLASGELVYTGALRTPVEAVVSDVPVAGVMTGVSAEGFALVGDVHVWRGDLTPADYTVAPPDGRPVTRESAGERIRRIVCADRDLLDDSDVTIMAEAIALAQIERIASAMSRVAARHPSLSTAVVTGLGAFLGEAAARLAGLTIIPLSVELGGDAARCAPAAAVALLLNQQLAPASPGATRARPGDASGAPGPMSSVRDSTVDLVVKVGGGVLADPDAFGRVLEMLSRGLPGRRALVVPGGGPFADAVRALDGRLPLHDDEAHWMAIHAMDQYAQLLASRLSGALVTTPDEIHAARNAGRIVVLAPYRWLRSVDPLPHSWSVTSDSIAAWVAGALGARQLVLVKPAGTRGERLVDAHFAAAVLPGIEVAILAADRIDDLELALRAARAG
jgi:probable H4MPT-linked C1 transfer pathway protein